MTKHFDDSLVGEFVAESREHLDAIEPDLLSLESGEASVSDEIINRIFRAIHSIKGGAGFLAYESLKNLSHTMESVLMLVREGKLTITSEIADVLLSGVDKLRVMVDDVQESDNVPCDDEIEQLQHIQGRYGSAPSARDEQPLEMLHIGPDANMLVEFDAEYEKLRMAALRGQNVYCVEVHVLRDLKEHNVTPIDFLDNIEALGQCLGSTFDIADIGDLEHCLDKETRFSILFSTALEDDLVGTALEIPNEQIVSVKIENTGPPATPPMSNQLALKPKPQQSRTPKPTEERGGASVNTEAADTLRVRVSLLTRLMNMAGELVLARNQLMRSLSDQLGEISGQSAVLQNIDRITTEIQEGIMQTRMQPVGTVFGRFPRVVRDISHQLNKEIEIIVSGAEVELDKSIVELLGDPLTHIIRNCADHAIELPADRQRAGKNKKGTIRLSAYHEGGQVNISIVDDGRGIDPEKVAQKAVEKNLVTLEQAEKLSQRDKINLIFAPGFSTADVVSEVSGRGVGMDVVRSNIEKLGGTVSVDSVKGEGTTVLLQLPLTLAIIPSLVVGVGHHRYAIPQVNVDEFVWIQTNEVAERIERIQGRDVLHLRGTLLPLVRLRDILSVETRADEPGLPERRVNVADPRSKSDEWKIKSISEIGSRETHMERGEERRKDWHSDYNIVVLKVGTNKFGAIVDRLYDTEEIVVKPLSAFIKACKCFSGATILGDGRVITILDVLGISSIAQLRFADLEVEEKRRIEEEQQRAASVAQSKRSVILFTSAPSEYFAVPQETIMRLERIDVSEIQEVGDREFIQYRGQGLPIVRLDRYLPVRPLPEKMREAFLIIPKGDNADDHPRAGIMVSQIVDALDVAVDVQPSDISEPGVAGSAIVNGQLTLFVDLVELMHAAPVLEEQLV